MNWYIEVLKKYVVFSGRARRKEYWMFHLFVFLSFVPLGIIATFIEGFFWVFLLYYLGLVLPATAVLVRRLHDIDKSAWWLLITLVPLVGPIWLFVLTVLDGTPGDNQYGANPKAS
jgi:uncharacterized membrane protein YhaH (DUF805 family)